MLSDKFWYVAMDFETTWLDVSKDEAIQIGLVEIDKTACETLRLNRPNWNVIEEDIVIFPQKDLLKEFNLKKGELDLLSGGYPCQSFSYAGKKLGLEDIRGTMFFYYAEFLRQLQPKMFLAENVKGLTSHDKGRTIKTMIDVFEDLGYNVDWKVLNAWDYGVAEKRQRVIILCKRRWSCCDRTSLTKVSKTKL